LVGSDRCTFLTSWHVADCLVVGECVALVGLFQQGRDDREQLGVAKRVGESVRAERVLVVAGVADERPAPPLATNDVSRR
jgi:hypothetical protein